MSRVATLLSVVGCLAAASFAATASADTPGFGIEFFDTTLSTNQAGAHPDLHTSFAIDANGEGTPLGNIRGLTSELPAGLVGNANAAPTCEMVRLASVANPCPHSTAVGEADANVSLFGLTFYFRSLVYNIKPYPDEPAAFALNPLVTVRLDTSVRSDGDYGITVAANELAELTPIQAVKMTFWGVPADHTGPGELFDELSRPYGNPGDAVRKPFLTNPSSCGGVLGNAFSVNSWEAPSVFFDASASLGPITGCEKLKFAPTAKVRPESPRAGAPTGYTVDVEVPQNDDPDGLATPSLKDAKVVLPLGVTLSPTVAEGLQGCTDDQIGLHSLAASACPEAAKVGTLSVLSPLLPGAIEGSVYLGQPVPGNRYRIFFSLSGYGVKIKQEGRITADPVSGQLTATFEDSPQLPFSELHVNFKGGPNAALVNPSKCGIYQTRWELTPWSSTPVTGAASMSISQGCSGGQFTPKLEASSANPVAGAASPFSLRVTREDGQQNVSRIDVTLPEGELAKLAGVPLCAEAQAASGACAEASQVGTTTVGVGAGTSPLYVPQPGNARTAVYLAGPYKGAPYSLVVKVPAQAGPFDLGTVAVRSGIYVDPSTTRASVKSDPLPQILEGIPLTYRDIRVEVNRPNFTINPTSCDPMSVDGSIVSALGTSAAVSSRFQVGDCASLGFKPKLALRLSGPTHRTAHPKLRAMLTMPNGGANIQKVAVTLPKTEFLENAHIQTICTRVQYAADNCPAKSIYGYAKAWTPLLDQPLQGPVYLRSSSHELPDLVASLDGQIHVELAGRIDSINSRIRNTFETVPDAPVSKFMLTMQGGKKGLLVNNTDLCKARPVADVKFDAQNGKTAEASPLVKADCGKKARKGKQAKKKSK